MRSKLFVPASRPELFPKALASQADALSFDLEDAVDESRKAEAREHLRQFLLSDAAKASAKTIIVRINPVGSEHFERDVQAAVLPRVDMINLPKVESVSAVHAAVQALERSETSNGLARPVRLLLNIETPKALRLACDLATAHPRVAGLQLGLGDLFEPLHIDRRDASAVHSAMFAVRMAAGEGGVIALDAAFANIKDSEGFKAEAECARRLGFTGKSCIHPDQVALVNEVFQPSAADIAEALQVVEAATLAGTRGVGAYVVGGKMIDGPFVLRAAAVVALARQLGLISQ